MPSNAPEETTDTEETTKPAHIMRRADVPIRMVSPLSVNKDISQSGTARHRPVPTTIMAAVSVRVVV